jgi:hypothetical protein
MNEPPKTPVVATLAPEPPSWPPRPTEPPQRSGDYSGAQIIGGIIRVIAWIYCFIKLYDAYRSLRPISGNAPIGHGYAVADIALAIFVAMFGYIVARGVESIVDAVLPRG